MTHTHQSEQSSTSDSDVWFKKNNYMSKFLSEDSKRIINKIKEKKYE
jgi:predicted transcriptional regulator